MAEDLCLAAYIGCELGWKGRRLRQRVGVQSARFPPCRFAMTRPPIELAALRLEDAMHIFPAPPKEATKSLLASCSLPTQDLTDRHFQHFFGCGNEGDPAGVVGVEILGSVGLLRSLAVAEAARGSGCGKRLIQEAEQHAASQGVEELYLLTSTARPLFESVGYAAVHRDAAPPAVRATPEFSSICPASATLMHKRIAA